MKNILKIVLGFVISLVYIPFSIAISYASVSTLTNLFNKGYESTLLNIIFTIIGFLLLLFFIFLIEKIINKIISKKILFMSLCCVIPIIVFCIGIVVLNFNFFSIQKDIAEIGINLLGDTELLNTALLTLTSLFVALAFIYLIVLVMYIGIYELKIILKKKREKLKNKN